MSDLRTAAQQVVDEHEAGFVGLSLDKAVAALKAALAEPQDEEIEALKNELAFWEKYVDHIHDKISAAQRQPLTEEDVNEVIAGCYGYSADFEFHQCLARAIERAHGIGGQDE